MRKTELAVNGLADGLEGADFEGLVLQDRAQLLYAQGTGGLAATAIASLFLVLMVETPGNVRGLIGWLCVMAAVLVLRAADLLLWHGKRKSNAWKGRSAIIRFGFGAGAAAAVWLAFPLLFFSSTSETGRASTAIVLAAMGSGSPAVLGAVRSLAIGYCLSLWLPFSFMFMIQPGRESAFLATLGLGASAIMTIACLVTCRSVTASICNARRNQILRDQAILQEARTQAANFQLQAAKADLDDANRTLEFRIEARTADLQHEISERRGYARALARLASNDALTGLFNRATLSERLTQVLQAASQNGEAVAVLFLDLDGFKQINDVQGHHVGDRVLRVVADRLAACCEGAHLARWGGDEFVIAVSYRPGWTHVPSDADVPSHDGAARDETLLVLDEARALVLADAIRVSLADPIDTGPRNVRVGVTIGIALYPVHGTSQDELIRAADLAMYAGKREGGGRVRMFDRMLALLVSERHLLEQALREALTDGAMSVHYQPIVNAVTGRCDLLEALLRWTHPERGQIDPGVFIPISEEFGQIGAIGRFVLLEACKAAMSWHGPYPPAVSVNVSIAQILSGQLLADVQAALEASGLPVRRLHLEITESLFVADHLRIMPVLEELRARGIHLALDDFGTGFSSLARLKLLPISTVKIDKSFLQESHEEAQAILRAIVMMARAMRMDVTAEGVETTQQLAMLTELGVTRLQGYLLARPMHAEKVSGWLSSRQPFDLPEIIAGDRVLVTQA